MGVKIKLWDGGAGNVDPADELYYFKCPGCKQKHVFSTKVHSFNGNFESPTLIGSVLHTMIISCHSFIENGNIRFLEDSGHELAGKIVAMEDCE